VLVHSVGLSLASIEPFKRAYFDEVMEVVARIPTTVQLSDHLCMTEKDGAEIGQLTPTPYNAATLVAVAAKLDAMQQRFGGDVAFENIALPFTIPEDDMLEPEFVQRLLDRSSATLLLDLNNLYTNAVNFGIDPHAWIEAVDLERVSTIHLAGGFYDDEHMLQDGHCARVPTPVWRLFVHVLREARRPITTIVERTGRNAEAGLEAVLDDQRIAQRMLDDCRLGRAVHAPAGFEAAS
jgi:uncharacterized protein (UPF0276 family)